MKREYTSQNDQNIMKVKNDKLQEKDLNFLTK